MPAATLIPTPSRPLLQRKKNHVSPFRRGEGHVADLLTRGSMVAQIRRAIARARAFQYLIRLEISAESISVIFYGGISLAVLSVGDRVNISV